MFVSVLSFCMVYPVWCIPLLPLTSVFIMSFFFLFIDVFSCCTVFVYSVRVVPFLFLTRIPCYNGSSSRLVPSGSFLTRFPYYNGSSGLAQWFLSLLEFLAVMVLLIMLVLWFLSLLDFLAIMVLLVVSSP